MEQDKKIMRIFACLVILCVIYSLTDILPILPYKINTIANG